MFMRNTCVVAAVAAIAGSSLSCAAVECGLGTIERQGQCVPADQIIECVCGPGTVLGLSGCEVEQPVVCDEATTMPVLDEETGSITCVASPGDGCPPEILCPPPDAGRATLCGRIWDAQTDQPVSNFVGEPTAPCSTPTPDGPCSLTLRFVDALDFSMNPSGAASLTPPDGVYVDGCSRYRGHNLPRATFGFIGVVIDDAAGTTDRHRLTAVAASNAFATPGRDFRAYATRIATDIVWSAPVFGSGQTFAERGVLAIAFAHHGAPRGGVQVRRNGSFIPADDFYFSDTSAQRDAIAVAQTATGSNGTALVINSASPVTHDGIGSEPAGCIWPSNLAASIAGVVFVQRKGAETAAGAACP